MNKHLAEPEYHTMECQKITLNIAHPLNQNLNLVFEIEYLNY